nr:MAG TPA: hypothetical protein [Bacteriophage sp.]
MHFNFSLVYPRFIKVRQKLERSDVFVYFNRWKELCYGKSYKVR